MIYAVLPYYPRPRTLDRLFACLDQQTVPYQLITITAGEGIELRGIQVLNAGKRIYWTESMQIAYRYLCTHGEDSDVVCLLIDDLTFDRDFFANGAQVADGEVLIPEVYEEGRLVDGGIEIDWKAKSFTVGRIDCFSPRGIFMKLGDFRRSGGFSRWLPHYASDYEWSIRLIKQGIRPRRLGRIETVPGGRTAPAYSKLSSANPYYWTIFLLLSGRNRYLPLNLLKVWLDPIIKRWKR